jgi:hypothetical protein
VIKLLVSAAPDWFRNILPASSSKVPRSATVRPRTASSLARCSSSRSCCFRRRLELRALGTSFLIPIVSPSSSVLPLNLSIASSKEARRPSLSELLIEFPAESRPFLSRRLFENIADMPFLAGEVDLSMVKDMFIRSS